MHDFIKNLNNKENLQLAAFLTPYIVMILTHVSIQNHHLNKDLKTTKNIFISTPPKQDTKRSELNIERITSDEIKEKILEFLKVLKENFQEDYLINFYHNINNTEIKKQRLLILSGVVGNYDVGTNEIHLAKLNAIFHELFHLSSSIYNKEKDIHYCGFEQYVNNNVIGKGLDEGYTELLTQRYFGKKYDLEVSYCYEIAIVSKLELIIGKNKMTKYYFNANLPGLINELKKYASDKDIINFIVNLDFICSHEDNLFIFNKNKIGFIISEISNFLINAFTNKLNQELTSGLIDSKQYIIKYNKFKESFRDIKISNHTYQELEDNNKINKLSKRRYKKN